MNGFLDISSIIFLVLAVAIFFKLRNVLGKRTGHERPPFDPYSKTEAAAAKPADKGKVVEMPRRERTLSPDRWKGFAAADSALGTTFDEFVDIDPQFDPRRFLEGAKLAYEMIVTAFAKGDRATLKPLLAREVYEGFEDAIGEREKRGETVDTTFVGIDKAVITDAALKGSAAQVTVRFVSQMISATKSKAGEIIDGDSQAIRDVTDVWTFSRDLGVSNPNWKLVATEAA